MHSLIHSFIYLFAFFAPLSIVIYSFSNTRYSSKRIKPQTCTVDWLRDPSWCVLAFRIICILRCVLFVLVPIKSLFPKYLHGWSRCHVSILAWMSRCHVNLALCRSRFATDAVRVTLLNQQFLTLFVATFGWSTQWHLLRTNRSDEGLTLETSAFSISVRWSIYIINSVDKPNFRVSLPHRRSTTVSSKTNPLNPKGNCLSKLLHFHESCFRVHGYRWETHRKMLLAVANEKKQGWSNSVRNIYCFIQSFKSHCLSSSGSYKLWLQGTGTLQFK